MLSWWTAAYPEASQTATRDLIYTGEKCEPGVHQNFKDHIRNYNNGLACALTGAHLYGASNPKNYSKNLIKNVTGRGPYALKVGGEIRHNVSNFVPEEADKARYSQLLYLESDEANQIRS